MRLIITIGFILFLTACNGPDFNTTVPVEKKLVVEGYISDQNEYQYLRVNWTTEFGEDAEDPVSNVVITVSGPTGSFFYNTIEPGLYRSEVPFGGVPGSYYSLSFEHEGKTYSVNTRMPSQVEFNDLTITPYNDFYDEWSYPKFNAHVHSNDEQYVGYEVYELNTDSLPDTSWRETEMPIYWINEVDTGDAVIELYCPDIYFFYFDEDDLIKIKLVSYSKDVGDYLMDLRNFSNSSTNGGVYQNPPYFFTGDAYGIAYGRVLDSVYYQF